MGALDLSHDAVEWLKDKRIIPQFEVVSPFIPGPNIPRQGELSLEARRVIHYAERSGPLYQDSESWRIVFAVVESFRRNVPSARTLPVWTLNDTLGRWRVAPTELLQHTITALGMQGFSGGPPAPGSVKMVTEMECSVEDLPQPYGMWLQNSNRPAWRETAALRVEIVVTVRSLLTAHDRHPYTGIHVELSSFAPSVVNELLGYLASTLVSENVDKRACERQIETSALQFLRAAQGRLRN